MAAMKYDPATLTDDMYALLEIVGPELFERIVDDFGGSPLYIVRRSTLAKANVYEKIRRDYAQGASLSTLADRYRYSKRHIREILFGKMKGKKGPTRGLLND